MSNKGCDETMPQVKQENMNNTSSHDVRKFLTKSWSEVMEDELNGKCDVNVFKNILINII